MANGATLFGTIMAGRSTFPIFDQALGGGLEARIRDWRAATPPISFEGIARLLRADDVAVSGETVRRWCLDLGIPTDPEDAA